MASLKNGDENDLPRCMIAPGNGGGGDVAQSNWYGWARDALRASGLFEEVVLENMPDPMVARESIWLPFIRSKLIRSDDKNVGERGGGGGKGGEEVDLIKNSVVVGHSSGAVAALRLAETHRLRGVVLVSACHTDLGDANERASGYYSRPWEWEKIRQNCGFIVQFHSDDDPFIPLREARHVAANTKSEYHELKGRSHFFSPPFPELVTCLKNHLRR